MLAVPLNDLPNDHGRRFRLAMEGSEMVSEHKADDITLVSMASML